MKTTPKFLRVLYLILLLGVSVTATAQNSLWVDTVRTGPREQVRLSMKVSNSDSIVALQCDVVLPPALTYVDNSVQLTPRTAALSQAATLISPNTLRIVVYSLSQACFEGGTGAVLTFDCQAGSQPGAYSVHLVNAVLSNVSQVNVLNNLFDGQIFLLAPSIKTSVDSVDFGRVPLGQISDLALTINNVGNVDLHLQEISSSLSEIAVTDSSSSTIGAMSSIVRTIRFMPVMKGTMAGLITLRSNDPADSVKTIKVRGFAYAVNELYVGSALGRSGFQTSLRLRVKNMEPFTALQCRLRLPPVMKYVGGSAVLLSRKLDHTVSADTSGNALTIVCFSSTNSSFQGNDGDVAELSFSVSGQGGSYAIPVEVGVIGDSTGANIISASYNGSLEIAAPKLQLSSQSLDLGTVSSVGQVSQALLMQNTGSDTLNIASTSIVGKGFSVNALQPLILAPGGSSSVLVTFHSSVEGIHSGRITVRSNDVMNDPAFVSVTASVFVPVVLSVTSDSIYRNRWGVIRIGLWNLKPVTATQFDLTIPAALAVSIDSLKKPARMTNHIIAASAIGSGIYRIIVYSPTSDPLRDTAGTIVEWPVFTSGPAGSYPVALQNTTVSDTSGHNVLTGQQDGSMRVLDIPPPVPSQTFLSFGEVRVGDSLEQNITLHNKSGTRVSITSGGFASSTHAFSLKSSTPLAISAGDSMQVSVQFKPDNYGVVSDTLVLSTDGGTARIALMGSSPSPSIQFSTRRLEYGDVGIYDTSATTILVSNSSPNVLRIDSVVNKTAAFAPSVRNFSVADTDTVRLVVRFIPTCFAYQTDSLLVWSNASTYLTYIDLSGNCPYPAIVIKPQKIDFGTVKKDSVAQMLFSIQDTSISRLQIDSLWTATRYFDVTHILANRIVKKGDSVLVTVRFTPDSTRQYIDTLYIANTSQVSPMKIPLSGNGTTTGVVQLGSDIPNKYTLYQNYPNPFNPSTRIRFGIPNRSRVRLAIFNILSQQLVELVNEDLEPGYFERIWNAHAASGLYIYRIEAVSMDDPDKRFVDVRKMLLLR